ncbi:phosphoribosylanthranilate isomerase [Ampullimonas aquatilis]|uniref:phosphoribosylanthranilate isomerase n=1 Tax=Ampullimonas aquatilis TaxID=1341549 RepID=UPI003C729241
MQRTRIKICGITREEDLCCAVESGADAIGLVFYPQSPRYIAPEKAALLTRDLPPFITLVGLFVNAQPTEIAAVRQQVPLTLLQFHGDELAADCLDHGLPFIRAARVQPDLDLLKYRQQFSSAQALLLDAFVQGYGGGGEVFDWTLIPEEIAHQAVLSGGLNAQNVAEAIAKIRPYAVDVSSGVESAKGIKDHQKIRSFIEAVRTADLQLSASA